MAEKSDWTDFPLVSGLLVFNRPDQLPVARQSIDSFFAQTWPYKELVVYNPTTIRLKSRFDRRPMQEIKLAACAQWLMESVCHANANGEWCFNWRSDCVYAPDYVDTHMAHRAKQRMVICKNRQALALNDQTLSIIVSPFAAWSFYRHTAIDFQKPYADQFEILYLDNPASLLTQVVREIA